MVPLYFLMKNLVWILLQIEKPSDSGPFEREKSLWQFFSTLAVCRCVDFNSQKMCGLQFWELRNSGSWETLVYGKYRHKEILIIPLIWVEDIDRDTNYVVYHSNNNQLKTTCGKKQKPANIPLNLLHQQYKKDKLTIYEYLLNSSGIFLN